LLEIPGVPNPSEFKTVNQFIEEGSKLPKLDPLEWSEGEGARRTAFLCYSSGTSGLPVRTLKTKIYKTSANHIPRNRKAL